MQVIPDIEFTQMRWDVRVPKGQVCKLYPDLGDRFVEFEKEKFEAGLSMNSIVKYIVLCYGKDSPFVKRRIAISIRKDRALIEAGFERDPEWPSYVSAVKKNQDDLVLRMILQFLKFERSFRFSHLMMLYERYWTLSISAIEFKSQAKDSKEMYDLLTMIEKEEDLVFEGDTDLGDHVSAIEVLDRRYTISPEQNASKNRAERKAKKAQG